MRRYQGFLREMRLNLPAYLLALPGVLLIFVLSYLPMVGVYVAFIKVDYRGLFSGEFVGLANFNFLFESGKFWYLLRNTLVLSSLSLVLSTFSALALAILINEMVFKKLKRVIQSILIFPHFISMVVVGVMATSIFSTKYGVLNNLFRSLGLPEYNFYMNSALWIFLYLFIMLWKSSGYSSIIYLAAITSVPQELYEAAQIDGAGRIKQIMYITLPTIKPTVVVLFLLGLGSLLSTDALAIYTLIGDSPTLLQFLDTIDTYVFRNLRTNPNLGASSSIALLKSVVGCFMIIGANWLAKKTYPEGALF